MERSAIGPAAAPSGNRKVFRTELTPIDFLRRSAFIYPDKTAVVHGDRRYSYVELEKRVRRLAAGLKSSGLKSGDRVAFLAPNIFPCIQVH